MTNVAQTKAPATAATVDAEGDLPVLELTDSGDEVTIDLVLDVATLGVAGKKRVRVSSISQGR